VWRIGLEANVADRNKASVVRMGGKAKNFGHGAKSRDGAYWAIRA
jgi:hypothetical protein